MSKKIIGIFLIFSIIYLFIGMSITPISGNVDKVISFCNSNNPPYEPSDPIPFNGTINKSICPLYLRWTGGDPDGDDVTYDVYFGKYSPPPQICYNLSVNCTYTDLINFNTTYYWKIVAWDEHGLKTSGPIWYFDTEENLPPYVPSQPYPEDGDLCVPLNLTLCWVGGDPNECDNVTYDVYFDDTFPPCLRSVKQPDDFWEIPYELTLYKTYYWQIVAWGSGGLSTEGPNWTFSTPSQSAMDVNINGPTNGKVGVAYTYTFNVPFPCGYDLTYKIDWGDSSPVESIGPSPPGVEVNATHTWDKMGSYIIRAKAIDVYGHEGSWSYLQITIPRNKETYNSFLLKFLESYPIFQQFFIIFREKMMNRNI